MDELLTLKESRGDLGSFRRMLTNILIGWLLIPAIACFIAVALHFVVNLQFIPEL